MLVSLLRTRIAFIKSAGYMSLFVFVPLLQIKQYTVTASFTDQISYIQHVQIACKVTFWSANSVREVGKLPFDICTSETDCSLNYLSPVLAKTVPAFWICISPEILTLFKQSPQDLAVSSALGLECVMYFHVCVCIYVF